MAHLDVDSLLRHHPALVDSAVRWRGVGGWGATATLLRAIEAESVNLSVPGGLLTMHLVPGVSMPAHAPAHGPFVKHGYIDGLDAIDRHLLMLIFDEIAQAATTDIAQVASYARRNPLSFWRRLRGWRVEVDVRASKLRAKGSLRVSRTALQAGRGDLVDLLYDSTLSDADWSRVAGIALVASLDDVVIKTARERIGDQVPERATGPDAVVWLACLATGRRSGIDAIRRVFSPLRPSSYPPAQYVGLVMPPHRRVRIIDDGSLRLGG
ncbi:MAG: hypothetical protein Q7W30_04510 [Coriobacteriia bacterium]|nr:hypothetical protein [Coriobacteriia bacterium]